MTIAIIEDEAPARRQLASMLALLRPYWLPIVEAESVEEARQVFGSEALDLVISDIQLSDGLVFEALPALRGPCPVIFTTAHDEFALHAFAVHCVDYLLKPIEFDALRRALDKHDAIRAHARLGIEAPVPTHPDWRTLDHVFTQGPGQWRQRLLIRRGGELRPLQVADVAYFRSDDKLTLAVDKTAREFVVDATLNELATQLDPTHFVRVNRQYIVAASAVVSLRAAGKGRLWLVLNPPVAGEPVLVSPDSARRVRDWLDR